MEELVESMRPLDVLIGRWHTSGAVLDASGTAVLQVDGIDEYTVMPGGCWVVHEVDVMIGPDRVRVLEMIGDPDPGAGTWTLRAFDASGAFDTMVAHRIEGGFLIEGDGARAELRAAEDGATMTATWERTEDGSATWRRWMGLRFVRDDSRSTPTDED